MARHLKGRHVLIGLFLGVGAAYVLWRRPPVGNAKVPEPAKPVDLQRYLGRWYEIARYESSFEQGNEGVTAEYALHDDTTLRILNIGHVGTPDGPTRFARATAKIVPGSGNAKLKVAFFWPFYVGNYWVLDHADDYEWAIVGEPSGRYLWILARQPEPDDRTALLRRAGALGYDLGRLRPTQHPTV